MQTAQLEAEIELLSQTSAGRVQVGIPKQAGAQKAVHSKQHPTTDEESLPPPLSIDVSEQTVGPECSEVSQWEKSQGHLSNGAGAPAKSMVHFVSNCWCTFR